MSKTKLKEERKQTIPIDGLEDFPLEKLGLSLESIEKSNRHILIPRELLPYIKICRQPSMLRERKAKEQERWRLKYNVKEVRRDIKKGKLRVKKPVRSTRPR